MSRRILVRIIPVLLVACFLVPGCSPSWKSKAEAWSKAQIKSKIKDAAKLSEIQLTETSKGIYEGTGKGQDATTYRIKVRYTHTETDGGGKNDLRWDVEDPKGQHTIGHELE